MSSNQHLSDSELIALLQKKETKSNNHIQKAKLASGILDMLNFSVIFGLFLTPEGIALLEGGSFAAKLILFPLAAFFAVIQGGISISQFLKNPSSIAAVKMTVDIISATVLSVVVGLSLAGLIWGAPFFVAVLGLKAIYHMGAAIYAKYVVKKVHPDNVSKWKMIAKDETALAVITSLLTVAVGLVFLGGFFLSGPIVGLVAAASGLVFCGHKLWQMLTQPTIVECKTFSLFPEIENDSMPDLSIASPSSTVTINTEEEKIEFNSTEADQLDESINSNQDNNLIEPFVSMSSKSSDSYRDYLKALTEATPISTLVDGEQKENELIDKDNEMEQGNEALTSADIVEEISSIRHAR